MRSHRLRPEVLLLLACGNGQDELERALVERPVTAAPAGLALRRRPSRTAWQRSPAAQRARAVQVIAALEHNRAGDIPPTRAGGEVPLPGFLPRGLVRVIYSGLQHHHEEGAAMEYEAPEVTAVTAVDRPLIGDVTIGSGGPIPF